MADQFTILPGAVVDIVVPEPVITDVVLVGGPQGTPGPPGPAGPSYSGVGWFFGDGPPSTVIGSKPGDLYINLQDGSIYRLGD